MASDAAEQAAFAKLMEQVSAADGFKAVQQLLAQHEKNKRPPWMDHRHVCTFVANEKLPGEAIEVCRSVYNAMMVSDAEEKKSTKAGDDVVKHEKNQRGLTTKFTSWSKRLAKKPDGRVTRDRALIQKALRNLVESRRALDLRRDAVSASNAKMGTPEGAQLHRAMQDAFMDVVQNTVILGTMFDAEEALATAKLGRKSEDVRAAATLLRRIVDGVRAMWSMREEADAVYKAHDEFYSAMQDADGQNSLDRLRQHNDMKTKVHALQTKSEAIKKSFKALRDEQEQLLDKFAGVKGGQGAKGSGREAKLSGGKKGNKGSKTPGRPDSAAKEGEAICRKLQNVEVVLAMARKTRATAEKRAKIARNVVLDAANVAAALARKRLRPPMLRLHPDRLGRAHTTDEEVRFKNLLEASRLLGKADTLQAYLRAKHDHEVEADVEAEEDGGVAGRGADYDAARRRGGLTAREKRREERRKGQMLALGSDLPNRCAKPRLVQLQTVVGGGGEKSPVAKFELWWRCTSAGQRSDLTYELHVRPSRAERDDSQWDVVYTGAADTWTSPPVAVPVYMDVRVRAVTTLGHGEWSEVLQLNGLGEDVADKHAHADVMRQARVRELRRKQALKVERHAAAVDALERVLSQVAWLAGRGEGGLQEATRLLRAATNDVGARSSQVTGLGKQVWLLVGAEDGGAQQRGAARVAMERARPKLREFERRCLALMAERDDADAIADAALRLDSQCVPQLDALDAFKNWLSRHVSVGADEDDRKIGTKAKAPPPSMVLNSVWQRIIKAAQRFEASKGVCSAAYLATHGFLSLEAGHVAVYASRLRDIVEVALAMVVDTTRPAEAPRSKRPDGSVWSEHQYEKLWSSKVKITKFIARMKSRSSQAAAKVLERAAKRQRALALIPQPRARPPVAGSGPGPASASSKLTSSFSESVYTAVRPSAGGADGSNAARPRAPPARCVKPGCSNFGNASCGGMCNACARAAQSTVPASATQIPCVGQLESGHCKVKNKQRKEKRKEMLLVPESVIDLHALLLASGPVPGHAWRRCLRSASPPVQQAIIAAVAKAGGPKAFARDHRVLLQFDGLGTGILSALPLPEATLHAMRSRHLKPTLPTARPEARAQPAPGRKKAAEKKEVESWLCPSPTCGFHNPSTRRTCVLCDTVPAHVSARAPGPRPAAATATAFPRPPYPRPGPAMRTVAGASAAAAAAAADEDEDDFDDIEDLDEDEDDVEDVEDLATFQPGDTIVLVKFGGGKAWLNGKKGTLVSYDAGRDRWVVSIVLRPGKPVKRISIGVANLELGQNSEEAAASSAECELCMSRPKSAAFQPCGHSATCLECAHAWIKGNGMKCPFCMQPVHNVQRLYF